VEVLSFFVTCLKKLRWIADNHAEIFDSEGFRTFFAMIGHELGDDYFAVVQAHVQELKFRHGVLISAQLGLGNRGTNYTL
jgi:hypothetical protein